MANIYPFQALRFDTRRTSLDDVLTQPYDKITPAMQEEYYRRSPFNLVRVELGKPMPGDQPGADVYSRAAACLNQWRAQGILVQDSSPSIYAYEQVFDLPSHPGVSHRRRGFIALLELSEYAQGIVHRHEQTLSKPKSDRMNLLQATHTLTGQIFMLYSDAEKQVDTLIWTHAQGEPSASITDEYGVSHRVWRIADPAVIAQVRQWMAPRKLIIADGHHRYETSLAYRDRRRQEAQAVAHAANGRPPAFDLLMSTFVNTESEGLVILPTHRVVSGLPGFRADRMLADAAAYFAVEALAPGLAAEQIAERLADAGRRGTAIAVCVAEGNYLLRSLPEKVASALAHVPAEQRSLDVVQLHDLLLGKVMGITAEQVKEQSFITYYRSAQEAVARLHSGASAVFLLNPVTMEELKAVAFAGQVMPQKSTDFYPKLLSGITVYAME